MDFDLRYPDGSRPVYLWSMRGDRQWCSVGAPSDFIPPNANEHIGGPEAYPDRNNSRGLPFGLDQESFAAIYSPRCHWLGYSPVSRVLEESLDPSLVAFGATPVPLTEHYYDVQRSGGSDDGESPVFAGYFLNEEWQSSLLYVSRRLYDVSMSLVMKNEYYGPNSWTTQLGDLPEQLEQEDISGLRYEEQEAQEMANDGQRRVLSQMGFISWYISAWSEWKNDLSEDEIECILELRLDARPKRGFVFDLTRDYHEINIPHLLEHRIPFHWCWTESESSNGRFARYGPGFLKEYTDLTIEYPNGPVELTRLPHYSEWEADLERYDVWFQDRYAGRLGGVVKEFGPEWEYSIVDFSHYGARPVDGPFARRAYAERFKGMVKKTATGTTCTFFRQNPIRDDEPPSRTIAAARNSATSWKKLLPCEKWRKTGERLVQEEPSAPTMAGGSGQLDLQESRPNVLPPPGTSLLAGAHVRSRFEKSPLSHVAHSQVRDWRIQLGIEMGSSYGPSTPFFAFNESSEAWKGQEGGSQRSFEEEYQGINEEGEILPENTSDDIDLTPAVPFDDAPGPLESFQARFQSREEAVQAIREWSSCMTEFQAPIVWNTDVWWNRTWLEKAILICEDSRTPIRMKVWAACCELGDLCDVLNMALCYGAAFALYVKLSDVRKVGMPVHVSSLLRSTVESLYDVGFTEIFLQFGSGGAACYGRYLSQILALLSRPHAVAFIAAGGILSFIAQNYDKELVYRFLEGPSVQVTEYAKGKTCWINNGEEDEVWSTDQVSEGEISVLLGHVVTGNPATDTFLWPHPSWLEKESDHFNGAWTEGAYKFLQNLKRRIFIEKDYVWRTRKEWTRYIRTGNKGQFAAGYVPTPEDFADGKRMIESAFPVEWEKKLLPDITIPEKFDPLAPRD
ncbi:hypothetical protein B0H13DRAFT_2349100 [Mycena leptocephala]|nr:hypothetical protein B0H13DRAFT_2349100 [Mycena leptocephala]